MPPALRSWLPAAAVLRQPPLVAIAAVLVYKALLDITYALVIPVAHYYALFAPSLNPIELIESYALLVPVLLALPRDRDRVSTTFLWLLVLISYVPMLTVYAMRADSRLFTYATCAFWVEVGLVTRWLPNVELPRVGPQTARRALIGIYAAMLLVSAVVLIRYSGLAVLRNLATVGPNLAGAYAARAEYVSLGVPLSGYYFYWLEMVFNPLFFTWSLLRRKWLYAGLIVVAQILIAGLVGMRQYYLVLLFVALIVWLAGRREPLRWLGIAFAAIVAVSFVAVQVTGSPAGYLFFVGRFLLDAAQLSYFYYDFFSKHGVIPGAYFIKFYIKVPYPLPYPYTTSPDLVISREYLHVSVAAVGGVVADAYMNLGLLGMAIWALVLGITARAADWCARALDRRLAIAVLAMPALAIADTYLVRIFFATGLLWSFLLLYLLASAQAPEVVAQARSAGLSLLGRRPAVPGS